MASRAAGLGPLCLMVSRNGPPAFQLLLVGRSYMKPQFGSQHKTVVCFLRKPGQPAVADDLVGKNVVAAVAGAALSVDLSIAPSALVDPFVPAVVADVGEDVVCVPHALPAQHPRTQGTQMD